MQLMDNSEYSISQVVEVTVQAVYSNQLSVTGRLTGSYQCNVANIRGGTFRVLELQSKFIYMYVSIILCMTLA